MSSIMTFRAFHYYLLYYSCYYAYVTYSFLHNYTFAVKEVFNGSPCIKNSLKTHLTLVSSMVG